MGSNYAPAVLKRFLQECLACDLCLAPCPEELLTDIAYNPQQVARKVLGNHVEDELLEVIKRCSLCGLCSQACPVDLNPAELFQACRAQLMKQGDIIPEEYNVMLMDCDWNFFTIYRDTYEIEYDDLQKQSCETLFFPGCALASYSPKITRAVFNWLAVQGMKPALTTMCCGVPLKSIGLVERHDALLDTLRQMIKRMGARTLVTACPNCFHNLKNELDNVDVVSFFGLLLDRGVQLDGNRQYAVHDSCPDRVSLQIAKETRRLLAEAALVEMEHTLENTLCCGSGGIVSMIDSEICHKRAERRLEEFHETGADQCVTSCMACAFRLARAAEPDSVRNILELYFQMEVDYRKVNDRVNGMWLGEWGIYNKRRLLDAKICSEEVADVA